jgi:predicted Zn finger-like uncharacterized protein
VIIDCICGKKKFRVPDEQMPREGRKVQCAACSQIWFYQPPAREELEEQDLEVTEPVVSKIKKIETVKEIDKNSEALKLNPDKIIKTKGKKYSTSFGPRGVIYLSFLLFFSLSIFLASIKSKVIMAFPFLKIYLNTVKILVLKLFKILGLF